MKLLAGLGLGHEQDPLTRPAEARDQLRRFGDVALVGHHQLQPSALCFPEFCQDRRSQAQTLTIAAAGQFWRHVPLRDPRDELRCRRERAVGLDLHDESIRDLFQQFPERRGLKQWLSPRHHQAPRASQVELSSNVIEPTCLHLVLVTMSVEVPRVLGVAVAAVQVAGGQTQEHRRLPGARAFALNALEDLRDLQRGHGSGSHESRQDCAAPGIRQGAFGAGARRVRGGVMTDKRKGLPRRSIRPVEVKPGFHRFAEGSVLYRAGGTQILVTASIDDGVPDFLRGRGKGWITAEYQMHPRANPKRRENRDGRDKPLSGRSREIQRLIGRSLRAAVDLDRLGERSIVIDADVLEADGGTRTAAITGGFIALALAVDKLRLDRTVIRDQVAAVSVGHVDGEYALDLCYAEDSTARVDLNVVATASGGMVEIQGTAEGEPVPRSDMDAMIDLGLEGVNELCNVQRQAIEAAGVDLARLMRK